MKTYTVYANCQGGALSAALSRKESFAKEYELIRLPAVQDLSEKDIEVVHKAVSEADLIIMQPVGEGFRGASLSTKALMRIAKKNSITITMPSLYFDGYFPHIDTLRCARPPFPAPFNLVHNYFYAWMWAHGSTPLEAERHLKQLEDHYLSEGLTYAYASIEELRNRENKNSTTIAVSGFIQKEFTRSRLFHTHNHPTGLLLDEVVRQVLERLRIPDSSRTAPYLDLDTDDLGRVRASIYPSVSSSLGLSFHTKSDENYDRGNKCFPRADAMHLFWQFYDSTAACRSNVDLRDKVIEEISSRKRRLAGYFDEIIRSSVKSLPLQINRSLLSAPRHLGPTQADIRSHYTDSEPVISTKGVFKGKKLWLHIGHPKCGSTFLQSAFSINHSSLAKRQISYPVDFRKYGFYDEEWLARNSRPSMGNCNAIFQSLRRGDTDLASTIIDDLSHTDSHLFLSCEGLFYQSQMIELICRSFTDAGFEANVIAFIPNTYRACVAGFLQRVRNHRYSHSISEFIANPGQKNYLDFETIYLELCRIESVSSVKLIPYLKGGFHATSSPSGFSPILNDWQISTGLSLEECIDSESLIKTCGNKSFCAEVYTAIRSFNLAFNARIAHRVYQNISDTIEMDAGTEVLRYFFLKDVKNAIEERYGSVNEASTSLMKSLYPYCSVEPWSEAPLPSDIVPTLNSLITRQVMEILLACIE